MLNFATSEPPLFREAARPSFQAPRAAHDALGNVCRLPGGYVDEGDAAHREVELSPPTGEDEYFLAGLAADAPAAYAVTGLLARCVRRVGAFGAHAAGGAAPVRELLVGDRDFLMLKLRELTFGKRVDCALRCPAPACRKPMDWRFNSDEIDFDCRPVTRRFFTVQLPPEVFGEGERPETRVVEFRLPTGADQEALASLALTDPEAAACELLARCVRRVGERTGLDRAAVERLPAAARAAVEEEMERLAPRLDGDVELVCPECGNAFTTYFDLTQFFLSELQGNLHHLEREVHFLAWHYHWSEQDILSMPRRKRRRYVALLQEEVDRLNQVW